MTRGLVLEGVAIALAGRPLLPRIDAAVGPGERLTVMGPSGVGKSTLLAFIGGFLAPPFATTGRVIVDGEDVTDRPPEARRIGILFQDPLLFPHLSVGGNLLFGLPQGVRGRSPRRAVAEAALAKAGLAGFADRDPASLSGGQQSRVAVLRTLLAEPRALLLDEPFGKLDAALRAEFRAFVFAHLSERGLPAVLVTHDPADAAAAGGRLIALD